MLIWIQLGSVLFWMPASRDGVSVGQTVIDAGGLMGQVIEVTPLHSIVLLLTDPDHAVPVTVARNGVRLIVYGRGIA